MKKLAIAMMLGIAAMSASAQVNYKMQVACNPQDVKTYDTNRDRKSTRLNSSHTRPSRMPSSA